jgi:hypothetical protein
MNTRKLTPGDAILLGEHVRIYREHMRGISGKQLRAAALEKFRYLELHRRLRGADGRFDYERMRATGAEALRMSRENGCVLP